MRSLIPLLAQAAEQVAEHAPAAEKSGSSLILPAVQEMIWGAVTFLILLGLLWWKAFPAIGKMLNERSEKIQGDIEGAEEARSEADKLLADYRKQLAEAKDEGNKIIEEARKTAESLRRDLIAKAEEEASGIVDRAKDEVEAEKRQAIGDLYREAGKVSIDLAEKVVGKSLDRDTQTQLIDKYINDLEQMAQSGGRG